MNKKEIVLFLSILILAVLVRLYLITGIDMQSDEGVWGLYAKHISELKDFIIFGSPAHNGALDPYISAVFFKLFGIGLLQLRLGPFLVYLVFLISLYILIKKIYSQRIACFSLIFAAIAPYPFIGWSFFCLGGYIWTQLLICCGLLILFHFIKHDFKISKKKWLGFGVLIGFSLYTQYIILVFWVVTAILFFVSYKRKILNFMIIPGVIIGLIPVFIYHLLNSTDKLFALMLKGKPVESSPGFLHNLWLYVSHHLPEMLGFKLDDPVNLFPLYLTAIISIFYVCTFIYYAYLACLSIKKYFHIKDKSNVILIQIVIFIYAVVHSFVYIRSNFGSELVIRYLITLFIPISIAVGLFMERLWKLKPAIAIITFSFIFGFNAYGYMITKTIPQKFMSTGASFPMDSIAKISKFCEEKKISHIYTDFHIAYKFTFYNKEKKIACCAIGPNRSDYFYPNYKNMVMADSNAAYVIYNTDKAVIKYFFESEMKRLGITCSVEEMKHVNIYYNFSEHFSINDLNLGKINES